MKKGNYTLQEISIQELLKKAQEFQRLKKWHFHILLPGCKFNEKCDLHAFILENEVDMQYFVNYSKKRHLKYGEMLVKLLYGDTILEDGCEQQASREIEYILERARTLNKISEEWEHHLLFPNCIFNRSKGKWVTVFEDKEEVVESITSYEPISDLKKIERLYYAQKK